MQRSRRFDGSTIEANSLLRWVLGAWNVFVGAVQYTYAQAGNGNWSNASVNLNPLGVGAINPKGNIELAAEPEQSLSALTNTAIIAIALGQSPAVGASPNVPEGDEEGDVPIDIDPDKPWITQIAPHPRAFTIRRGTLPNPDGAGRGGNRTLIPSTSTDVDLVPLVEGINYNRTNPSKPLFRETAITSATLRFALALPASSIAVGIAPGNGSSPASDIVGKSNSWVSATWSATDGGEATYTSFAKNGFVAGTTRTIASLTPSGYNVTGTVKRVETVDDVQTKVVMSVAGNPGGSFSGSVAFDDPAIPMQSTFNLVQSMVSNGKLGGRNPVLVFFWHIHEADTGVTQNVIIASRHSYFRTKANELAALIGAPTPIIVCVPTQKPRGYWGDAAAYTGELALPGLGAAQIVRSAVDSNLVVLNPMAAATTTGVPNVHRNAIDGYQDWGEHGALLVIDKMNSVDAAPLHILENPLTTAGSPNSQYGSGIVTVPLSHSGAVFDGYSWITDPGNGGVQLWTNDVTYGLAVDPPLTTNGRTEDAVDEVEIVGSSLVITEATPGGFQKRQVSLGLRGAIEYQARIANPISAATWALEAVTGLGTIGVATFTTVGNHTLVSGDAAPIFQCNPSDWDNFSSTAIALPGTTGSTLKVRMDIEPAAYIDSGQIIISAEHGLGPTEGCRHTLRLPNPRGQSIYTAKDFYDTALSDIRDIKFWSPHPRMYDAVVDFGLTADWKVILDARDTRCYGGSGQTFTNLGSTTTTDDYYLGLGSGSDARDPTFNGSADSLAAFFSNDGGDIFSPVSASKVLMNSTHKSGGGSAGLLIFKHKANAATQALVGTRLRQGGGPGTLLSITGSGIWNYGIRNDADANVYVLNGAAAMADNTWHVIAWSLFDGDSSSFAIDSQNGMVTDNVIYGQGSSLEDPSTNDMESDGVYLWQDGDAGVARGVNGAGAAVFMLSDTPVPRERLLPLFWTAVRQVKEGLYT